MHGIGYVRVVCRFPESWQRGEAGLRPRTVLTIKLAQEGTHIRDARLGFRRRRQRGQGRQGLESQRTLHWEALAIGLFRTLLGWRSAISSLVFRNQYSQKLIRPRHSEAFFATTLLSHATQLLDSFGNSAWAVWGVSRARG